MDATGQNMCEYNPNSLDDRWQVYYGAMNQADWEDAGGKGGICGKCIVVRGVPGQTTPGFNIKDIYVKIVDQCPDWACDRGSVDFSTTALKAITGFPWDKKRITWDFVPCPDSAAAVAAQKAAKSRALDAAKKAQSAHKLAAATIASAHKDSKTAETAAAKQAAAKKEALASAKNNAASAAADKARDNLRRFTGRRLL